MQIFRMILTIFASFLLISQIQCQFETLTSKRDKYCGGVDLKVKLSDSEIKQQRIENRNTYTGKYNDIIAYQVEGDTNRLIKALMPGIIFMGIIVIVTLCTTMIVCLVFCKNVEEQKNPMACISLSFTFCGIATVLFFAARDYNKTLCGMYTATATLREGSNDTPKFIGLQNLMEVFKSFGEEAENLKEIQDEFERIDKENPAQSVNRAQISLSAYVTEMQQQKTQNGNDKLEQPLSTIRLSDMISDRIESDFNFLNSVGFKLKTAAEKGKNQFNYFTLKITSQIMGGILQLLNFRYDQFTYDMTEKMKGLINTSKSSAIMSIVIGSIILILCLLLILYLNNLTKINAENQREDLLIYAKMLLVFVSLIVIIYAIITLIMVGGNSVISSICGFISNLNKGNTNVLKELDNKLMPIVEELVTICFNKNSDGQLKNILLRNVTDETFFQNNDYQNIIDILDGVGMYRMFQGNITDSDIVPVGIQEKIQDINSYRTGLKIDHYEAKSGLEMLNNLVSCNNQFFVFNEEDCEGSSECLNFQNQIDFTVPECSNKPTDTQKLFDNLKSYIQDQKDHADFMEKQLTKGPNSPSQLYKQSVQSLLDLHTEMDVIQKSLSSTLNVLDNYNVPLKQLIDCREIRENFLSIEVTTCFSFNKQIHNITIINIIVSALFVVVLLTIYFTFLNGPELTVDKFKEITKQEKQVGYLPQKESMIDKSEFQTMENEKIMESSQLNETVNEDINQSNYIYDDDDFDYQEKLPVY